MHGCCSGGSLVIVNAGVDSMGGVIDGGVEISSAPSLQKSSDLEKTQAELRETFSAAEKFRRELDFLQKGGDPLDLKTGVAASVSLQSTSLTDQHPEQFVTSEVKGSFGVTASPHGDSVESSGRLGAPSVTEPNSADNLMLFDGENKFHMNNNNNNNNITTTSEVDHNAKESGESVPLELPKKSYKRRIRSRPNRDGVRSSSTDAGPRSGQSFFPSRHATRDTESQEQKHLSNSTSKPKSPNLLALKNLGFNSRLDVKLNGGSQNPQENLSDQPLKSETQEHESMSAPEHPPSALSGQTKGFDSKSSSAQIDQSLDDVNNKNEVPIIIGNVSSNGNVEAPSVEGNDVNTVKDGSDGDTHKETEGLNGSESVIQHELKNSDVSTCVDTESVRCSIDGAEQNACDQNNLKVATKEHEDSILEEARIIEEKRKRIAGLSVAIISSESRGRSHWHFVLEEMSWLANDFTQERLWKVTAAAQISQRAAYSSRVRFQKQSTMWKQKEVAHILAEAVMEFWHTIQVKSQGSELEGTKKDSKVGLHQYGMRFLEYNSPHPQHSSAQAPVTPDRIPDLGSIDISWEENLTEENLFYTVPPGAIEAYRKSIESHLLQCERTGSSMQEEVDASGYDAVADNTLEEDEGETSTYYLPGAFEGSRASKNAQKKRKHFKSYNARSYDTTGPDFSFTQSLERNIGNQPSVLSGKRPATNINVSIPTKRVRTASRPRFTGTSGYIQPLNRADASSGDTNSFQDEQSSLHGGSHVPNNMEAESVGDYEKQLQYDMTEVSNRPKKKKKAKHPGSTFDHRWQLDSNFQNDQKDHSKRRLDTRQFDTNGNSVGSQMSNMSNPNKFMKLLVRDRGRKSKLLKIPGGPQGPGSPWSLFEDQALVVLVHDMGANWELISDAINSTLQFKCISRNSKECKERHKVLMDRNTGDGADSAEDSGSSQPYPSTLPGIPEGSARQLFQRLQGPMEEDTLKSHFEKIIVISQKLHYRKSQKDNHDPKQLQQPHSSHALALSQVCPNNLNGGPVLTPLDLCDTISPSPDFLPPVGYQGPPHSGGLPMQNHGSSNVAAAAVVGGSSSGSSLPASSNMSSHLASAPLSPSVRDGRYGIPRTGSLSIEEQHRMQQYNQMLSARNMSLPPGSERGVRMLPGGGMNRSMGMARPSSSLMNPGAAPAQGQGTSVRPRDALHMMRPNQNTELPMGASFPNQTRPISPQQSPHMPNANSHHPAYGMRIMKERQLQQQRMLQQQFGPSSNPMMPHGQPQLPGSSPQTSTAPSMKHPVPPPHGIMRNPQTAGTNPLKQQQLQRPRQFQPQQHAKTIQGVGRGTPVTQNVPLDSSLPNGTQEKPQQHLMQTAQGQGNLYSGPSGSNASQTGSKQSMPAHQLQQKRYPGQPQPHPKLIGQTPTTAVQRLIQNRKAINSSADLPATGNKLLHNQTNTSVSLPPSSDTPVNDSSAADDSKQLGQSSTQHSAVKHGGLQEPSS